MPLVFHDRHILALALLVATAVELALHPFVVETQTRDQCFQEPADKP